MEPATVRASALRIAEHATAWRLPRVNVILHGGEPLLLGHEGLRAVLAELRATIAPSTGLRLSMQTNGVLLTPLVCDLLGEFDVRVGVSLDGDREANDRHRRFTNGASSHAHVLRALALLRQPEHRPLYGGLLCTIDVRNDPIAVYEALAAQAPPRIDFLLPHATWDSPPHRPGGDSTPYATWLSTIFQRWTADGRPTRIRLFDSLLSTAGGGRSGSEQIGSDAADLVVVETDGTWEQADSLKTAYDGAPETGASVHTHSVDEVSTHPAIHQRQLGLAGLSDTCRACPIVRRCGGGLYAHRYRAGSGFDNPSVYCADLKALVARIDRAEEAYMVQSAADDAQASDHLDQIAVGLGDGAAVRWLAETQLSITRALLAEAAAGAPAGSIGRDGWDLLTGIDRDTPAAVRRVGAHPYLRSWAVATLRDTGPERTGHLATVAAAAALLADTEAELSVPVHDGAIYLPTLGTVRLSSHSEGTARLSLGYRSLTAQTRDEKLAIDLGVPSAHWRPVRRVFDSRLDILLEDSDPDRDCHSWPTASPLDAAGEAAWHQELALAWKVIEEESSAQVAGLEAGLRAIVPLEADATGNMRASTARDAFGAVAASFTDHRALAVMIVHEFQHSKLGAVLDLYDLYDPESTATLKVGWRPDRRPVEGALQGTYAHLAVAEIWRGRAARGGAGQEAARRTYAQYRAWTLAAVEALQDSGALTRLGEQFVERMASATENWTS
ncbi:hypothetical protein Psuf_035250 [Phytohabitans suffuscus]|uniref:Radical SAM core domain-containing protein n=2 Tax=Phytohabitans suffuscus TaxID=624315 RepID=A0A6F8YJD1_9ACTN|nr:hypothetical protein Psuf_035250 [Phytohabitans suffuscus]